MPKCSRQIELERRQRVAQHLGEEFGIAVGIIFAPDARFTVNELLSEREARSVAILLAELRASNAD